MRLRQAASMPEVAEIVPFIPRAEAAASVNLNRFIELARHELDVFGSCLDFDSDVWDLTLYYKRRETV